MIAHRQPADHDELPIADVDAARLWSASGCQAITHRDAAVPVRLVATTAAVVDELDAAGAGLGKQFGSRGLGALSERAASLLFRRSGRTSCGGGSRLLPALDGWVAVTLARPTDRELLPAWLGVDPGAACVVSNVDPWSEVARRIGDRRTGELVDTACELGLACAAVGECRRRPAVVTRRRDGARAPCAATIPARLWSR